ncbi:hypothetical protein NQZ68_024827 [Dissostichus eleginoides]|nr:hypothetical protein NQZ68_024827 [Dissostichus eleginoides]
MSDIRATSCVCSLLISSSPRFSEPNTDPKIDGAPVKVARQLMWVLLPPQSELLCNNGLIHLLLWGQSTVKVQSADGSVLISEQVCSRAQQRDSLEICGYRTSRASVTDCCSCLGFGVVHRS